MCMQLFMIPPLSAHVPTNGLPDASEVGRFNETCSLNEPRSNKPLHVCESSCQIRSTFTLGRSPFPSKCIVSLCPSQGIPPPPSLGNTLNASAFASYPVRC